MFVPSLFAKDPFGSGRDDQAPQVFDQPQPTRLGCRRHAKELIEDILADNAGRAEAKRQTPKASR
jgi:hypothetical protein